MSCASHSLLTRIPKVTLIRSERGLNRAQLREFRRGAHAAKTLMSVKYGHSKTLASIALRPYVRALA